MNGATTPTRFLEVPRLVVTEALAAASARGDLRSARHEELLPFLAEQDVSWHACLEQLVTAPPARVHAIVGGLMRGVYVLPARGERAWHAHTLPQAPVLESPGDAHLIVSYASEDRELALALRGSLDEAGCTAWLIDVAEDPDDPVWWLRYRGAMARVPHFVPLLSGSYLGRAGSREELSEAASLALARADDTSWFPILPAWATDRPTVAGGADPGLLSRLPGLPVRTAGERQRFAEWAGRVVVGGDELHRWLRREAVERRERSDPETSERFEERRIEWLGGAAESRLRRLASGEVRLLDTWTVPRLVPRSPRAMDEKVLAEIDAKTLRRDGRPAEAASFVAASIAERGFDASVLIELAEDLREAGFRTDALLAYREARRWLGPGHSRSTHERVAAGTAALAPYAGLAPGRTIGHVLARHARPDPPDPRPLRLPVPPPAQRACSSLGGIGDYFSAAGTAAREGDLDLAEGIMLAASQKTVFDRNRARALYMAGRTAAAAGRDGQRRALRYAALALDHEPDDGDSLELLRDLLGGGAGARPAATHRSPDPPRPARRCSPGSITRLLLRARIYQPRQASSRTSPCDVLHEYDSVENPCGCQS